MSSPACPDCGREDTEEHVVLKCEKRKEKREELFRKLEKAMNAQNIIGELIGKKNVYRYVCDVISTKEKEQRVSEENR